MLRIFASARCLRAVRLVRCAPNPSKISIISHWGLSFTTGNARYPLTIDGAIPSHASSVMYAFSVMHIVDPSAQPSCLKKVSLNPDFLFFPFNKKTVGPLCPAATPVRYMVVDAASSRASAAAALHKHATARWATRYDDDNYGDGRRR